jgi:DNA-binding NtrC family response regulator
MAGVAIGEDAIGGDAMRGAAMATPRWRRCDGDDAMATMRWRRCDGDRDGDDAMATTRWRGPRGRARVGRKSRGQRAPISPAKSPESAPKCRGVNKFPHDHLQHEPPPRVACYNRQLVADLRSRNYTVASMHDDTAAGTHDGKDSPRNRSPGLLVVFSAAAPMALPVPLQDGVVVIGRAAISGTLLPDDRLSRRHAEIRRTRDGWIIRDLGSRNGTFVDGVQVQGEISAASPRVIRLADTLLVPVDDLSSVESIYPANGPIIGARLRDALKSVTQAAAISQTLLVRGESGTGKELAARRFHSAGPHAQGAFVAVNCAAIPEGLAERLLFGTKRGAYSGASTDAEGHLQAADNGVLFLDEAGELDLQVQAKLLRALETREVLPLGASLGHRINVRVCVATHVDLRAAVSEGRFRADLYYRLAPPEVVLPPLRERLDEISWHAVSEIARVSPGLTAHASLVEACLLRAWPGNVRELRKEINHAAARAVSEASDRVRIRHLGASAGCGFKAQAPVAPAHPAPQPVSVPVTRRSYVRWSNALTREQVERALLEHQGNVALAAKSLGMQRTQLYREMERLKLSRPMVPTGEA